MRRAANAAGDLSLLLVEIQFLHQRNEARFRAERIEDVVGLEPWQPLRVLRVSLLEVIQREGVIAQAEMHRNRTPAEREKRVRAVVDDILKKFPPRK